MVLAASLVFFKCLLVLLDPLLLELKLSLLLSHLVG